MSSANVRSIHMLHEFRAAMVSFREDSAQALGAVEVEIRRMVDWLTHDQLKYWQVEIRRREDVVGECRADLNRCLMSTASEGVPSCSDQKKALEKAKRRLTEAQEKLEKVKQWSRVVEQEVSEYRGPAQSLSNLLDAGVPQALAMLDRKIAILEAYADMLPGGAGPASASSTVTSSPAANSQAAKSAADDTPTEAAADRQPRQP
ncbi:MAG TPA: hypothetical protein VIK18_04255 [Pirellulales bacterium]